MASLTGSQIMPAGKTDVVNILLVDDEVRNLDVLESILASPNHRLVRAQAAQEALMALIDGEFAAIVLDIQMPGTNGLELAHLIKQRKRTQHIPIIFLTAYFQEDKDIIQGYEIGAVDYLTKPIDSKILKSKIAVFVELFQKNRELEKEIAQRLKAEEALLQANGELEARVQERIAAHTDLARQKEVQTRLYDATLSSITDLAYTFDLEGNWIYANKPLLRIWGKSLEEITGKSSLELGYPPGLAERLKQQVKEVVETRQPVRGETYYTDAAGVEDYHEYILSPVLALDGTIAAVCGTTRLTTEQRRAGRAAQQLAAIVESSADAIISKDINGVITSWNFGAQRLFGYHADEVIGKPVTILIPKERWDEEPNILARVRRGERIEHYETIRQRKDGSLIEISLTVSPMKDSSGKIVGASKIGRDITQQKQAERELERAHKEAVAASRAKDDFLAALSHELRTPLNPVLLLASDSAENPELPDEIRAQFTTIRNNVELEARLIDDLLDITRITHGKLSLNTGWVDVHAVLKEAIATLQSELNQKQVSLTLKLAEGKSAMNGDTVRLQQIFWNVLKNAVKFNTEGGKITVETSLIADGEKIAVKIIDTGIGLTAQEISRIFNAFSQGDHASNEDSHHFGGLGLGLTISRMLVELHSGMIYAMSDGRGKGATFVIELPLVQANKNNGSFAPSDPLIKNGTQACLSKKSGMRILLVEDHEPTRTALTNLLTRRDYTVMAASSVTEARAIARQEKFDLVVSDIGLPDGNGYILMSELRDNFGLKGIALTGYGMEQDMIRGQNAGFVAYLIKPVRVECLEKALRDASLTAL
jgi:PAS domain S-box-containing protein